MFGKPSKYPSPVEVKSNIQYPCAASSHGLQDPVLKEKIAAAVKRQQETVEERPPGRWNSSLRIIGNLDKN